MSLESGARLGPYEIVAAIGAGGMGEVYRARDTRLGRDVALKVSAEAFSERFEREARAIAALNHPNICSLYDVGPDYLVMELVEGQTLDEMIHGAEGSKALPREQALAVASQIALALEAAHEAGIIHRDLKPANIKVKEDGTVKVLDFGLAKAMEGDGSGVRRQDPSPSATDRPTFTSPALTELGVILGTAAYMSPEQARGRAVDKRVDIWAFGVILYEMLTGRRLFDGETVSDTIAAVLRETPDLDLAPADTRRALAACLVRDPRKRLRDIGDIRLLVGESGDGAPRDTTTGAPPGTNRVWQVLTAIGLTAALVLAALYFARPALPAPGMLTFEMSGDRQIRVINALSPNGREILYALRSNPEGPSSALYVRSFESLEGRLVPGSTGISAVTRGIPPLVTWSSDSRAVAFGVGRSLRRTDLITGQTTTLADGLASAVYGPGAWNVDGTILFGIRSFDLEESGIWRVPAAGGQPVKVTSLQPAETLHRPSTFLPDGRRFLYFTEEAGFDAAGKVRVGSLDTTPDAQDSTALLTADAPATYAPPHGDQPGYLLFLSRGSLMAQVFDAERAALAGDPVQIASGASPYFSVSSDGRLAYRAVGDDPEQLSELVRFSRQGERLETIGPPAMYGDVNRLADGRRLAVARTDGNEHSHLHIVDIARQVFTRLNPGVANDYASAPAPDDLIAYTSTAEGTGRDIYVRAANGVGDARLLLASETVKHPNDWSPDGRFLIFDDHVPSRAQDLTLISRDGGDPIPFLATEADETFGQFSPDGKWVAYRSNESGRSEVYVRDFAPDRTPAYGTEKVQISVNGGDKPRWSPTGREITFIQPGGMFVAVAVRPGAPFEVSQPVELFQARVTSYYPYTVMPDGTFVLNTLMEAPERATPPVVVMVNWQSALRR